MRLFADIEKTIERGFRKWTGHMLGPADSDELLLVHRAILEAIEGKVLTAARGRLVFPYASVTVTLVSPDADRRALYQAAWGAEDGLESEIRQALTGAQCQIPAGFSVAVQTAETGEGRFTIDYAVAPAARPAAALAAAVARLVVVKGKAAQSEYTLDKPRTNIGRLSELTDAEQRVVRRNDVAFEEGDETGATVSRRHAHIRLEAGEYRIHDDGSEFGTRIFRQGRALEVPAGDRRGERLRPGDEIYVGRACLRFEQ